MDIFRRRLLMMQGSESEGELPSGYTKCNYIENTSNAYIDTKVLFNHNLQYECEYEGTRETESGAWNQYPIFGYRGSYGYPVCYVYGNTANVGVIYGDLGSIHTVVNCWLGKHKLNIKKTIGKDILTIDNTSINLEQMTIDDNGDGKIETIYLFTEHNLNNTANVSNGLLKIYHFNIKNGERLVRDFIPAKDANGDYGLFDMVEKKFYKSPNGTKFIGG